MSETLPVTPPALAAPQPTPPIPPEPVWPGAQGPSLDGAPPLDWSAVPGFGTPTRTAESVVGVAPPRPLAPLGGEVVDAATVALQCAGVPGATGYEIELSPDIDFADAVLALDAGSATEIALPGVVPVTGPRLFWRVRARTAAGPTAWSRRGRFYPALGAPVDRFRADRDAAVVAFRKRRDHDRLAAEAALDAVPLHERPDVGEADATFVAVVLVMGLTVAAVLVVTVLSLVL